MEMSLAVYISQSIRFARVCSHVDDFSNRNNYFTSKLLKHYRYHNSLKLFSKFYYGHSELIVTILALRLFCYKANQNLYFMAIKFIKDH